MIMGLLAHYPTSHVIIGDEKMADSVKVKLTALEWEILNDSFSNSYDEIHDQLFAIQEGMPAMRACTNLDYILELHEAKKK